MIDPSTGIGIVTSIQIQLKPGVDAATQCRGCGAAFARIVQRADLARQARPAAGRRADGNRILNVLLFLIIAVAGFGILAIFFMIVVEKTRDIGILKSLGASGRGIMGIFLGYGLSLGIVGSRRGHDRPGCCSSRYINKIAGWLSLAHRPTGVQSRDLLLPTDSDPRRSVYRDLDRDRGDVDRGGGQHFAGAPCCSLASRGGLAL